jgi:alkylhydroperoxidase family enzyme
MTQNSGTVVSGTSLTTMTGRELLRSHAPDVARQLDVVAGLPAPDLSDPRVRAFAEQFGVDVSVVDDELRAGFLAAAGRRSFDVAQLIWVHDQVPRLRTTLGAAYGDSDWTVEPSTVASWPAIEGLMRAVARLDALDPVTTELVRLRGARQHNCAVCRSRRSREAIDAGADDTTFDAVDSYAASDLSAKVKAALALTDSMIWSPGELPDLAALTEAEVVEVVLDVMRNAANKIAVALGADAATITDGVELFRTDADGELVLG